jgi:signal peptidase I
MRRTRKRKTSKTKKTINFILNLIIYVFSRASAAVNSPTANEKQRKSKHTFKTMSTKYKQITNYKTSKIISKTISIALFTMLIIIVAAALYMKLSDTSKISGHQFLIVTSGSMEPTILTGSVIAIKDVENKSALKAGDIITYKSTDDPNQLVTHRILEVEKLNDVRVQYITQGDNNNTKDQDPIPDLNVVGKYANIHIPVIGYIFAFISSKLGAVLFMIIPGIIIIGWQLINIWKLISNLEKNATKQTEVSK